tara:strand:+ start:965 stop:1075 length:111 start_codon:yes stop_codon:yes gene_type:complete
LQLIRIDAEMVIANLDNKVTLILLIESLGCTLVDIL